MADNDPSLADMILEMMAGTQKQFEEQVGSMQAELSRLSAEIRALNEELDALRAAPGDHRKEIDEIKKKMTEKIQTVDTLVGEIKIRIGTNQDRITLLSAALSNLDQMIKDTIDGIGR